MSADRKMTPPKGARGKRYVAGPGPWCGTSGGYANHDCRCDECRAAWGRFVAQQRHARAARPIPADLHGKATTYTNYRCRCTRCRAAWTTYHREYRARKRQAGAA